MRLCIMSYIWYFLKIQTWSLFWGYIATFQILFYDKFYKVFLQVRLNLQNLAKVFNLQRYLKKSKSDPKDSTTYQIANSFLYNFYFMQICLLFIYPKKGPCLHSNLFLSIYLQSNWKIVLFILNFSKTSSILRLMSCQFIFLEQSSLKIKLA